MTYQELQAAYDKLLQENERLRRVADDAREKLEAAMDGTGLCIWQNHVPTGKLIIFNRRWGSMLGYQPKELSAHFDVWREHLHPEDRERVLQAFFDHLSGKSPFYQVMHRMIAKDGKTTWVLDRGRVVERDAQGNPVRVMGTHIDITHEKEYEQQLAWPGSPTWIPSPALPTAPPCNASSTRVSKPSASSIWTTSSRSTTTWATAPVTSC